MEAKPIQEIVHTPDGTPYLYPDPRCPEREALADLRALQTEIEDPQLDSKNPHYGSSYTSLREVLRIARPLLNKHNFILVQRPLCEENGRMELHTELIHKNGFRVLSVYALTPVKNDPQGIGAAITYARRFALKAMLAMADADDDGNEASGLPEKPEPAKRAAPKKEEPSRLAKLAMWVGAHEEEATAFLRAPTFGKDGEKVAWIGTDQNFAHLTKEQLAAITGSEKNLERFKAAVLAFSGLTPPP